MSTTTSYKIIATFDEDENHRLYLTFQHNLAYRLIPASVWVAHGYHQGDCPFENGLMSGKVDPNKSKKYLHAYPSSKKVLLDFIAKWPNIQDYLDSLQSQMNDLLSLEPSLS